MLNQLWFSKVRAPVFPEGIIVPFLGDASSIPSGWEQFTSADDKAIKGHSSTPGTTSGSTSIVTTTSRNGAHTGSAIRMWIATVSGAISDRVSSASAGDHNHSVSMDYHIAKRKQVLMRATSSHKRLPLNAGVLSDIDRTDLTDVTPTGGILHGTSSSTSSNAAASAPNVSSGVDGGHAHNSVLGNGGGTTELTNNYTYTQGGHSHTISGISVTDNQKRIWLGLWKVVAEEIPPSSGMYALWESGTAPVGWYICDGNNGTPDLTDHFIGFDKSKLGVVEGNGTINVFASVSSHGAHRHISGTLTAPANNGYHGDYIMANHSAISLNALSFESPSYTLVILKYGGL